MEREVGLKDTQRNTQNATLNIDLFQNIFWIFKKDTSPRPLSNFNEKTFDFMLIYK